MTVFFRLLHGHCASSVNDVTEKLARKYFITFEVIFVSVIMLRIDRVERRVAHFQKKNHKHYLQLNCLNKAAMALLWKKYQTRGNA